MRTHSRHLPWIPSLLTAASLLVALSPLAAAATGPAESIARVEAMIEAHGGMEAWASAPSVEFQDRRVGGEEPGPWTRVIVEQGPRRACLDVLGTDMRMAWDGEKAWSVAWEMRIPPRFLALLDYYFLNLPWLALDPGVVLGDPGTAPLDLGDLAADDTEYVTVKMTFQPGVGDTPDDYYLLYIHPESHRLVANEYIVTYEALLPEGTEHSPPHVLVYDGWTEVGGLTVPTAYTIYEEGEVFAALEVREWSFDQPFDPECLEMPEGAVVDESTP